MSGLGWCQPMQEGEHGPRQFLVWFDDAEKGVATFTDEKEAREFWEKANLNWNCYLFGTLPLATTTPADVGELVERLLRERKVRLGDIVAVRALLEDVGADAGEAAAILTAQATALERVVRERDEARADVARKERPIVEYGRELYDAVQMWWHGGEIPDPADMQEYIARSSLEIDREKARATSAEAKLAEARKVIEPFAEASREFNFAIGPDGIDDGITVIASTVVRDREATLSTSDFSAARRWIEETK
jgi:hypothetical protein